MGEITKIISRRDFLKLCGKIAAVLGLSQAHVGQIADALEKAAKRPPVIWLHLAGCTGCTESVIKTSSPSVAELVLDILSIDYHDNIMASAGDASHKVLEETRAKNAGRYIMVVEGAVPMADDGAYLTIGGRTGVEIAREIGADARIIIPIGACAFDGGSINYGANPSKMTGVMEATGLPREKFVCLPGCPVNPINLISIIAGYLLRGRALKLDSRNRPEVIYGKTVHEQCERKKYFDKEQFVERFGSKEAKAGWCLFKMGCKGPATFANCPTVLWDDRLNWCVGAGSPCIGCTEPNYVRELGGFYQEIAASKLPADFFA